MLSVSNRVRHGFVSYRIRSVFAPYRIEFVLCSKSIGGYSPASRIRFESGVHIHEIIGLPCDMKAILDVRIYKYLINATQYIHGMVLIRDIENSLMTCPIDSVALM